MKSQAAVGYLKLGFLAVCVGLLVITSLTKEQTPVRSSSAPAVSRSAPALTVVPPAERLEIQPASGNTTVSIQGLRWCRYQQVRIDGANAYLEALRPDPTLNVERFNAAVAAYNVYVQPLNASCGSYTYRRSDALVIDAEVNEQQGTLTAAGRRAMESVYLAASTPASANIPAYRPSAIYVPPAPVASVTPSNTFNTPYAASASPATQPPDAPLTAAGTKSYADGQSDRRTWEAWIQSTSGAARDGAEWWASVRSTQRPPSCTVVPGGNDPTAAAAGCNQARIRLGNSDRRRRAEPDYRTGWNNP